MGKIVASIVHTGMSPKDGIQQGEGQYWEPIPDEKMDEVLRKVKAREYKYMRLYLGSLTSIFSDQFFEVCWLRSTRRTY